jgi:hypothetical protein
VIRFSTLASTHPAESAVLVVEGGSGWLGKAPASLGEQWVAARQRVPIPQRQSTRTPVDSRSIAVRSATGFAAALLQGRDVAELLPDRIRALSSRGELSWFAEPPLSD